MAMCQALSCSSTVLITGQYGSENVENQKGKTSCTTENSLKSGGGTQSPAEESQLDKRTVTMASPGNCKSEISLFLTRGTLTYPNLVLGLQEYSYFSCLCDKMPGGIN